jgi:hypothetical protein
MKSYRLALLSFFFLSCSCKKEEFMRWSQNRQASVVEPTQTVSNPVSSIISAADTVAPANAINVKKYGAVGDGIHDDTKALQSAINAETVLLLPVGVYAINGSLNMRTGVKIYGSGGATVKAGNSLKGTLSSRGIYFNIENADNTLISNVKFQKSSKSFNLGIWANACILIRNSSGTTISYNNFDFNLPYSVAGLDAVWVSGSLSSNNLIKGNRLISVGIEYAEDGANSTTADGNYISHAPSDGLSAHGNTDIYCSKNVVSNNIVENSGLMGIEDYGKVDGTLITNNVINGVGKDPSQGTCMGISAVGINSKVVHNTISGVSENYIEAMNNSVIDGNIINDTQGKGTGIMCDFTHDQSSFQSLLNKNVMTVTGNTINGCLSSIVVFGDYSPSVDITGNTMTNPLGIGVNVDTGSLLYTMNIANNSFVFNIPNTQTRKAFESYDGFHHSAGQIINLTSNTVSYATSADGGAGLEYGFIVGTDNVTLNANNFNCNNIKGQSMPVVAISGDTDPAYNLTLTNNMVYGGGTVNLSDFTIKSRSGNNFD